MKERVKKYLFGITIVILACLIPIMVNAATQVEAPANISAEYSVSQNGITIKIKSNVEMKYIKLYRKAANGNYILFYKGKEDNVKEKDLYFSRNILPDKVSIKIVVVDKNNVEHSGDMDDIVLPEMPSINPSETEKPSWSPSPIPTQPTWSATPTPSTSTSPTTTTPPQDEYETIKYNGKKYKVRTGDKVYFLDVSDYWKKEGSVRGSDCMLICSEGKYGLVDCSYAEQGDRIYKHLKELGVKELEFVIASHDHFDHIGGYAKLAKRIPIKKLYAKKEYGFLKAAKNYDTKIIKGSNIKGFDFGNFTIRFYSTADLSGKSGGGGNVNCLTAVATHKASKKKIYFSGDIQNNSSKGLYPEKKAAKNVGRVDVYKVGHHGYNSENNSQEAIDALKPDIAVVPNHSGRPSSTVVNRIIKKTGKNDFYYAGNGTVLINIEASGKISKPVQFPEEKTVGK